MNLKKGKKLQTGHANATGASKINLTKYNLKQATCQTTKETRFESFLKTEPSKREKLILSAMTQPMTARQIARVLGFYDLNAVRPRLTEMVQSGRVEVIGKAYDEVTNRNTAVYRRIK